MYLCARDESRKRFYGHHHLLAYDVCKEGEHESTLWAVAFVNFLVAMDRNLQVTEMPALTDDNARSRVGSLLGASSRRSFRTLAEVRLFQSQGLLTDDEVADAFYLVGGQDGLTLLEGSAEDRKAVVYRWLSEASR